MNKLRHSKRRGRRVLSSSCNNNNNSYYGLLLTIAGYYYYSGENNSGFLSVTATLQAALILPHGDAAWDPSLYDNDNDNTRDAAQAIATAARQASAWFTSNPNHHLEVILVVSPHGVALSNDFGIFLNDQASGSVELGRDDRRNSSSHNNASNYYTVDLPPVPLALDQARDLVQYLSSVQGQNVTGLQFPENPPIPMLRWAEVIPLLLLQEQITLRGKKHQSNSRNHQQQQQQPRYIIWTQPLRRYEQMAGVIMIPELLQLGHEIRQWMDSTQLSYGVLVSGDLSHRHTADGPYGVDPVASRQFDAAVGAWAAHRVCDPASSAALLETAAAWQSRGLSCGFTGFVLLQGILCGDDSHVRVDRSSGTTTAGSQPQPPSTTSWRSQVLVNRNVTYFGMMVANFSRQDDTISISNTSVMG